MNVDPIHAFSNPVVCIYTFEIVPISGCVQECGFSAPQSLAALLESLPVDSSQTGDRFI